MGIMRGNPLGNLEIVEAGSVVQIERKINWKADYELSGRTRKKLQRPLHELRLLLTTQKP
jgi:hypothetical protein